MQFKVLVKYSERLRRVGSRNAKIDLIVDFMRLLNEKEGRVGIHYISGKIRQGKISLAWKGLNVLLGIPRHRSSSPELLEVDDFLQKASQERGRAKAEVLAPLFRRLGRAEREHLVALIIGEVQQGVGEGLVRVAIADMFGLSNEEIDKAYLQKPDIAELYALLRGRGKRAIDGLAIKIFSPVKPMLAQIAESIDEVFDENSEFALEYKLDGIRIQVHRMEDEVKIYSRHLRDITEHFPELTRIARQLPIGRFILDGEAIGIDKKGMPVPFQILARRTTRKRGIADIQRSVPVIPQFFDALYIDADDLTGRTYAERVSILEDVVRDPNHRAARSKPTGKDGAIDFYERSLRAGHEGVVVKLLQSEYRPGKRGSSWFKIKGAHTIDCVILAAEWGHGRRHGLLSNLHLGVFDETKTKYLMVGKTFKGLTDNMLHWLTDNLPGYKVHEDRWTVYVKPIVVVEVAFNEVQKSPKYESGVALRFARVKRIRKDKTANDINSMIDLEKLARIALSNTQ